MNLAKLLTRRVALAAPLLTALGLPGHVEADACTRKCKKKESKDKRQKCLKRCKRKDKNQQPLPPPPPPPQAVQISGTGPQITAPFHMVAGRYIATASISATETDNFIMWLHGPGASFTQDLVVNEIPEAPGNYQYQSVIHIEDTGSHFLEVSDANGSWNVVFAPA
jgi:hypothetical protein